MNVFSLIEENIKIALGTVRTNLLRTILTVLIIATGIMALVGILTAIDSIKNSISSQFTRMGANTFTIRNRSTFYFNRNMSKRNLYQLINYKQALDFKEKYTFPAYVSIEAFATHTATIKYKSKKTDPKVAVRGITEDYIYTSGLEIDKGRNFSSQDVLLNHHVAIIGSQLATDLFGFKANPINSIICVGAGKYKIVGVLKSKGASIGDNADYQCLLPLSNVRQYFSYPNMSFSISIKPIYFTDVDAAISEAEMVFRKVRRLKVGDNNNFEISKSDNLANMLIENIKFVTIAATIIGILTLFGAAIGLMNIMLVAVAERTREIGTRKALGAKASTIRQQFLFEAVFISQLGGALGILLGILIGNTMSLILKSPFIVPWLWILGGFLVCFIVGIISGIYPAIKASKLDPIVALRYE